MNLKACDKREESSAKGRDYERNVRLTKGGEMSALSSGLYRPGIIHAAIAVTVLFLVHSAHSAPVQDDSTQIAEYDAAHSGCYYNLKNYEEGERIITNEPCLNCTCHNKMLMCYLRVCPLFTKAIGQDCKVEKREDQCCPIVTCPEVPVRLLASTTNSPNLLTSAPESTDLALPDTYGCNVDDRFYPDGAQLPVDPRNPCELCYCIRNRTTCLMQECTLRIARCKPVYQSGVCCPVKYNCDYEEEHEMAIDTTPGLLITTTLAPGAIAPQCTHEGKVYNDGDLVPSDQACQHCYCFRGKIACAVQECGEPMEPHGKNCTALPPPEGECCTKVYECDDNDEFVQTTLEPVTQIYEEEPKVHENNDVDSQKQIGEKPQESSTQDSFPGADNSIPDEEVSMREPSGSQVAQDESPSSNAVPESEPSATTQPDVVSEDIVPTTVPPMFEKELEIVEEKKQELVTEPAPTAKSDDFSNDVNDITTMSPEREEPQSPKEDTKLTETVEETHEEPKEDTNLNNNVEDKEEEVTAQPSEEPSVETQTQAIETKITEESNDVDISSSSEPSATEVPEPAPTSLPDVDEAKKEQIPEEEETVTGEPLKIEEVSTETPVSSTASAITPEFSTDAPKESFEPTDVENTDDLKATSKTEEVTEAPLETENLTESDIKTEQPPVTPQVPVSESPEIKELNEEIVDKNVENTPEISTEIPLEEEIAPTTVMPERQLETGEEINLMKQPEHKLEDKDAVTDSVEPVESATPENRINEGIADFSSTEDASIANTMSPMEEMHSMADQQSSTPRYEEPIDQQPDEQPEAVEPQRTEKPAPEVEPTQSIPEENEISQQQDKESVTTLRYEEIPNVEQTEEKFTTKVDGVTEPTISEHPSSPDTIQKESEPTVIPDEEPTTPFYTEIKLIHPEEIRGQQQPEATTLADIEPSKETKIEEEAENLVTPSDHSESVAENDVETATKLIDLNEPHSSTDIPSTTSSYDKHTTEMIENKISEVQSTERVQIIDQWKIETVDIGYVTEIVELKHPEEGGRIESTTQSIIMKKETEDSQKSDQNDSFTTPKYVAEEIAKPNLEETEEEPKKPQPEIESEKTPEQPSQPEIVESYPTTVSEFEVESTTAMVDKPDVRIPGEGNCLVDGQSYNNNSAIPPANACQLNCKCVSSIVRCDLINCPPPPSELLKCTPVIPNADTCCPIYTCESTSGNGLESDSHIIDLSEKNKETPIPETTPAPVVTDEPEQKAETPEEIIHPEPEVVISTEKPTSPEPIKEVEQEQPSNIPEIENKINPSPESTINVEPESSSTAKPDELVVEEEHVTKASIVDEEPKTMIPEISKEENVISTEKPIIPEEIIKIVEQSSTPSPDETFTHQYEEQTVIPENHDNEGIDIRVSEPSVPTTLSPKVESNDVPTEENKPSNEIHMPEDRTTDAIEPSVKTTLAPEINSNDVPSEETKVNNGLDATEEKTTDVVEPSVPPTASSQVDSNDVPTEENKAISGGHFQISSSPDQNQPIIKEENDIPELPESVSSTPAVMSSEIPEVQESQNPTTPSTESVPSSTVAENVEDNYGNTISEGVSHETVTSTSTAAPSTPAADVSEAVSVEASTELSSEPTDVPKVNKPDEIEEPLKVETTAESLTTEAEKVEVNEEGSSPTVQTSSESIIESSPTTSIPLEMEASTEEISFPPKVSEPIVPEKEDSIDETIVQTPPETPTNVKEEPEFTEHSTEPSLNVHDQRIEMEVSHQNDMSTSEPHIPEDTVESTSEPKSPVPETEFVSSTEKTETITEKLEESTAAPSPPQKSEESLVMPEPEKSEDSPALPEKAEESPTSTSTPEKVEESPVSPTVERLEEPSQPENTEEPIIPHLPEKSNEEISNTEYLSTERPSSPVDHSPDVSSESEHQEQPSLITPTPNVDQSKDSVHDNPEMTHSEESPNPEDVSFPEAAGDENFNGQDPTLLESDPDYTEEDQAAYGPGTCRYGGKIYMSAQQIPRDDPCDFCFCFRSDIICLQQSCPPPIPSCNEEPINGFCCPRYECPVSMATSLNLTTTTTTTTTTLPPHFLVGSYKGSAKRGGCLVSGKAYLVGEVIREQSGPCMRCICGGDGNMQCDPQPCSPNPMLREMIATSVAKRRRR